MNNDRPLLDVDIDNIEAAALGKARGLPSGFAHPADTLKLVAEIRRLKELCRDILYDPPFECGDIQQAVKEAVQRGHQGLVFNGLILRGFTVDQLMAAYDHIIINEESKE